MNQFVSFYSELKSSAEKNFPSIKELDSISWDHLISPYVIKLPKLVRDKAEKAIRSFYRASRRDLYQSLIEAKQKIPFHVTNDSILMAYDFHATPAGDAKLVEINTNASGYLFSALMNCAHTTEDVSTSVAVQDLKGSFEEEGFSTGQNVAIVDDNLAEQKMFSEFLMYRDLLNSWGANSRIEEAAAVDTSRFNFIYNRSTDFYLMAPEHKALRNAWENGSPVISPQPREYLLLADKERLIDFSKEGWLERAGASQEERDSVREVLIPSFEKDHFGSVDELWSQRRTLFFKPKHSYGGKSVYRGESVSRKVFDRLMSEDILIQKYFPASPLPDVQPGDPLAHWKFDVRFFVYRDRIQQVAARLYQGQVTNFSTPLGGFTRIEFV
jgi:hypothetical protein